MPMTRGWRRVAVAVLFLAAVLVVHNQVRVHFKREASRREAETTRTREEREAQLARIKEEREAGVRRQVFDDLQPVPLEKCQLERFGETNDGGYLACGNLLEDVKAAYSYGINGYDKWGCDVSLRFRIPTHQYDCFNTAAPSCPGGRTVFHAECVGGSARTEEGRPFDTIANQLSKNGDGANRVILKIDVEGAEWESFAALPDDVLERIDQLIVEFHRVDVERTPAVIGRLKRFFHVAHFHANNASCDESMAPLPSWAYEVSFVNRRLDRVAANATLPRPHPLDAKNSAGLPDCQPGDHH